jgi:hypothetical protein
MSNDLDKDIEWLKRLVAAMDEICLPCSETSGLDSQSHSLLQRLKLPAAADASDLARIPPACFHSC